MRFLYTATMGFLWMAWSIYGMISNQSLFIFVAAFLFFALGALLFCMGIDCYIDDKIVKIEQLIKQAKEVGNGTQSQLEDGQGVSTCR